MISLYDLLVATLIGAGGLLIGILLLNTIRAASSSTHATPQLQAILHSLEPYVYQAIFAGERALIWSIDGAEARIAATDKRKVAESCYALLPDFIMVGTVPIPTIAIKKLVSLDDFADMVKNVYDHTDAFLQRNEQYLKNQVEGMKVTGSKTILPAGVG